MRSGEWRPQRRAALRGAAFTAEKSATRVARRVMASVSIALIRDNPGIGGPSEAAADDKRIYKSLQIL
jgi:hypothetical protein